MNGSAIAVGRLRHRRFAPRSHAFSYRVHHLLVDVDRLDRLDADVGGLGHRRRAVVSLHDGDHLGDEPLPLRLKLDRWLVGRGVDPPAGRVLLWANPRILGYGFNPVSWWFCHDPDDVLRVVVAEVHNTFGDQYAYVLDDLETSAAGRVTARRSKRFHVSPFLPIEPLDYRFVIRPPRLSADGSGPVHGSRIAVHMDVTGPGGKVFDATLGETLHPLTTWTLARTLVTHPLMTLRTTAAIHRQALVLWRKQVPFHRRPAPPDPGYHAITAPERPAPPDHPAPTATATTGSGASDAGRTDRLEMAR